MPKQETDTISSVREAIPGLEELAIAIDNYRYPCFVYDFSNKQEIDLGSMAEVEGFIRERLVSSDTERVKDGLSNVLFWGYYRSGRRNYRVNKFRALDSRKLRHAVNVFASLQGSALSDLKRLKLPEFGCLSFLSKLRTFLDPSAFCVMDLKLRDNIPTLSHRFKVYNPLKPTYIPVTRSNEESYVWWVGLCRKTALQMAGPIVRRPVDVERGFFQMVDSKKADRAESLIRQLDQT